MNFFDQVNAHIFQVEEHYVLLEYELLVLCPKADFVSLYKEVQEFSYASYKTELLNSEQAFPPGSKLPVQIKPTDPPALWGLYRGRPLSVIIAEVQTLQIKTVINFK